MTTTTKTTVANVRSPAWAEAVKAGTAVYVGRACAGFKGSPFGNPWKVGTKSGLARGDAVELYRQWAAGTREHPKGKPFPREPHALFGCNQFDKREVPHAS